jgi:hypothetical protein
MLSTWEFSAELKEYFPNTKIISFTYLLVITLLFYFIFVKKLLYKYILYKLSLSDITSKFHIILMFVSSVLKKVFHL